MLTCLCRTATTFGKDGALDEDAMARFLQRFVDAKLGIYLASAGSGESHAMTRAEIKRVYEIGGPDVVSYGEIMREYARQRRLRRAMISVPLLTPHLSSLWLGLVTPVYARVGRELIEGLRNPSVVRDPSARAAFAIRPAGLQESIARAIRNEDHDFALTRWSDALQSGGNAPATATPAAAPAMATATEIGRAHV